MIAAVTSAVASSQITIRRLSVVSEGFTCLRPCDGDTGAQGECILGAALSQVVRG